MASLSQGTSTSTNSTAALGSPLPAYRMLFPNIAVHRYGTVLISMPWASMLSAAIRPGREKQQNKRGSSAPGQALWSALRSQHSINISSPRVQGNQGLLLRLRKKPYSNKHHEGKSLHRPRLSSDSSLAAQLLLTRHLHWHKRRAHEPVSTQLLQQ